MTLSYALCPDCGGKRPLVEGTICRRCGRSGSTLDQGGEESTGTEATGFALAKFGPFECQNCQKWVRGFCGDPSVVADISPGRETKVLEGRWRVQTDALDCCNEFLSRKQ